MELVYLWVEKYKNIKEQGFNFSPRFTCDYDGEKLTIKENNDYIENFFGENINVTAIVGKNGSGKSSVFEIIEKIYINEIRCKFIICFTSNNEKKYVSNITNIDISSEDYSRVINDSKNRYIGDMFDFDFLTYSSEMPYNYGEKRNLLHQYNLAISMESNNMYKIISKYMNTGFELTSFMFLPETIYIQESESEVANIRKYITPMYKEFTTDINCLDNMSEYINEYMQDSSNILENYFMAQLISFEYLCKKIFNGEFINLNKCYREEKLEKLCNDNGLNKEEYSFIEFNKILNKKIFKYSNMNDDEKKLIEKYKVFLEFDFEDIKERKYSYLSHGEKIIFGIFLNIYDKLVSTEKSLMICLDEPDLAFHPQWQKKYFFEMYKSFKKFSNKIYFIITTHSPFLLSDIPKQNIIFLDKEEDGNCKVLTHDEVLNKKQTFGANIHTLLSDSFFMEDGLMGEFAKGKINEIIDFHKKVEEENSDKEVLKTKYLENQKKFWQTQSIVGEAYLKQVLENHLIEIEKILLGKDGAKSSKKERLLAQLKELDDD